MQKIFFMVHSTILKIALIVSHSFIIIGLGHGVGVLAILEIIGLGAIVEQISRDKGGDLSDWTIRLFAILTFVGQIAIIVSIAAKAKPIAAHISGIILLWASLFIYAYGIRNDNYSHILTFSCVPFSILTLYTFLGKQIGDNFKNAT
jgi:hypothetical protein